MLYDQGKDSHETFGNGEYQLLRSTNVDQKTTLTLHNCDCNASLLYDVKSYSVVEDEVLFEGKCPVYEFRECTMAATLNLQSNAVVLYVYETTGEAVFEAVEDYTSYFLPEKPITVEKRLDGSNHGDDSMTDAREPIPTAK